VALQAQGCFSFEKFRGNHPIIILDLCKGYAMVPKRTIFLLLLILLSYSTFSQINIYLGGNLQGNYSWVRGEEHTYHPGFGGGFSFVYWEYEYWFLKAGIDYNYNQSSSLQLPENYEVPITGPEDKVQITYKEQCIGIPLTIYFRPYESGENSLIVTGSLEMMFVAHLKEDTEEYGELVLSGNQVSTRTKTNVGIGAGYQRQLDRHMYLNIYPSYHMDIRAERAFNSINLTAELIFGIY